VVIEWLAPYVRGRQVVVVGSAPMDGQVERRSPDEVIVAVNGGISSVVAGTVDVWVLNARSPLDATVAGSPLHPLMVAQGAERRVGVLVLVTKDDQAAAHTRRVLLKQETDYHLALEVNQETRRAIETGVGARTPDLTKHALSVGMFATALCFEGGAEHVRLAGFSWKGGYQYAGGKRVERGHAYGDRRAIANLEQRYGARLEHALGRSPSQAKENATMATAPRRPATPARPAPAAAQPAPTTVDTNTRPRKVRALKLLQYGLRRRRPGDVFMIAAGHFRPSQMEYVSDATPERTTTPAEAARNAEAEVLANKTPRLQPNAADLIEEEPPIPSTPGNLEVI
jgi:hypothetical protein